MATAQVMFGRTPVTGIPVASAGFSSNQVFTTSGTSQATTLAAKQGDSVVTVTVTGGNVYIKTGTAPTAVADATSILILDGTTRDFGINLGDKLAVINA